MLNFFGVKIAGVPTISTRPIAAIQEKAASPSEKAQLTLNCFDFLSSTLALGSASIGMMEQSATVIISQLLTYKTIETIISSYW
ncbi:MAG: hypothetical protein LUQ29_07995 [Methylococcaceae bacterium]|nr:hypothetical protein [Methylococcaceae bacterium]